MVTIERLHWISATSDGFDLHTDGNNLGFLFDPFSVVNDRYQNTFRKVLRWVVKLSLYNYISFHVLGQENVWEDLNRRWISLSVVRRLISVPPLLNASDDDLIDQVALRFILLNQNSPLRVLPTFQLKMEFGQMLLMKSGFLNKLNIYTFASVLSLTRVMEIIEVVRQRRYYYVVICQL